MPECVTDVKVWENSKKLWKHEPHSMSRPPKLSLVFLWLDRNTVHVFYLLNVGYTHGHLHKRGKWQKKPSRVNPKLFKNLHGTMPQDLLKRFEVLKKSRNIFDC